MKSNLTGFKQQNFLSLVRSLLNSKFCNPRCQINKIPITTSSKFRLAFLQVPDFLKNYCDGLLTRLYQHFHHKSSGLI